MAVYTDAKPTTQTEKPLVTASHLTLGQRGETAAVEHLGRQGYILLARNWRCRFGEADLIMRDGDCVVFVEVRTRRFGVESAFLSVDERKRHKLRLTMLSYLSAHNMDDVAARLDIVAVRFDESGEHGMLSHAKDVLTW